MLLTNLVIVPQFSLNSGGKLSCILFCRIPIIKSYIWFWRISAWLQRYAPRPQTHKDTDLLLYFSHSVNLKRTSPLEQHNIESIFIEVCLKRSKPILLGFTYRNPSERTDWFDRFILMMNDVCLEAKEIILPGVFNISLLKPHTERNQLCQNVNLVQLSKPTRITTNCKTLIRHIYVTTKENIAEVCSPVCGCSDLLICITWFKKGVKVPEAAHRETW